MNIKEQFKFGEKMTSIQAIPIEVLFHIFTFLSIQDMKQVITVCTKWNNIGVHKKLWQTACRTIKYKTLNEAKDIIGAVCR